MGVAPSTVSGLVCWLKRADGQYTDAGTTPATTHGDRVYRWADQSGANNHFEQTLLDNRPSIDTADQHLSTRTVRFNGGVPYFLTSVNHFLNGLTAMEIFIVIKIVSDPPAGDGTSGLWDLGNESANDASHFPYTDSTIYESFGTSARKTVGNPASSLASAYRCYNVYSASNAWRAFLDGTGLLAEITTNTVAPPTSAATTVIGTSDQTNISAYLDGRVAEVFIYNRKVTDTERTNLTDYALTGDTSGGGGPTLHTKSIAGASTNSGDISEMDISINGLSGTSTSSGTLSAVKIGPALTKSIAGSSTSTGVVTAVKSASLFTGSRSGASSNSGALFAVLNPVAATGIIMFRTRSE